MYDPIFAKSFNQYQRRRFGCCALLLCFITAFSISSTFNSHRQSASVIGDAVSLQLAINAVHDMRVIDDTSENHEKRAGGNDAGDLQLQINATDENSMVVVNNTSPISQRLLAINETRKTAAPFHRISEYSLANYYAVEGDIRIEANSSTIFVVIKPLDMSISSSNSTSSWSIQPYPRKGLSHVKNWTLSIVRQDDDNYSNVQNVHRITGVQLSFSQLLDFRETISMILRICCFRYTRLRLVTKRRSIFLQVITSDGG
ncbi:UNVERIFIED_CONTAM: hypothetical protein Scaly_0180200 [Sesamum calycinum]|uniref:Uncharacterized protein n=1 Tax=Sesamum calycinum TaxID=2727403 RepID=A0AAW2SY44_9LAMI